jgi:hypothetical protein
MRPGLKSQSYKQTCWKKEEQQAGCLLAAQARGLCYDEANAISIYRRRTLN